LRDKSRPGPAAVPTPDHFDDRVWVTSHWTGLRRLSEKSLAEFQSAVRKEQKERLQLWELRAKVVGGALTGLTGVIGALIGLIAIFKELDFS
jgi:hypothetical protein